MSRLPAVLISLALTVGLSPPAVAQYLDETREAVWSDPDEPDLLAKASELGTAPALYEFVRNTFAFVAYDGARSDATNTFLHRRGNDVDLASVLVAMLRSQGIPARYAEGVADFSESDVRSWLEIPHPDRAADHLLQAGFSDVDIGAGRIAFRHTWVQALAPLERYRGAGSAAEIDCTAQPDRCTWVDLDPSFKRHRFRDPAELVDVSQAVLFDYDAYYHADDPGAPSPDGLDRASKGPLEVYEEQILQHLRTTPGLQGRTLEDVVYEGEILPEVHGILPTSLPFRVDPLTVQTYASVEEHDAAPGADPWTKTVRFTVTFPSYEPFDSLTLSSGDPVPLVELSTENLTFAYESTDFDTPSVPKQLVARLGGAEHEVMLTLTGSSYTSNGGDGTIGSGALPGVGTRMEVHLTMDGAGGGPPLAATYPDLTFGGAYLVATGGEHSSWSQVHRSARRLLQAVEESPVLPNEAEGGLLYVDANGNGSIDAGEVPLLEDAATQNRLTGGVLAVAKDLYYARIRDAIEGIAKLQRSTMPPVGFLGLVSAVHDVRSVDGTAFQIVPTGLLVDMKAITVAEPFRIDADVPNDRVFRLGGHIISALEHEIWQELTGFEAISTMKGIQRTLADEGTLLFLDEGGTQDTIGDAFASWGFQQSLPAGFSSTTAPFLGYEPWLPRAILLPKTLSVVRASVSGSTPAFRRKAWELDVDRGGSGFEPLLRYFSDLEQALSETPAGRSLAPPYNVGEVIGLPDASCVTAATAGELEDNFATCIEALLERDELDAHRTYLEYFDTNGGYAPGDHLFRELDDEKDIRATSLAPMRDELELGADPDGDGVPDESTEVEFVVPSIRADADLIDFAVWIRRYLDASGPSAREFSAQYAIHRAVASSGGGGSGQEVPLPTEIVTRTIVDRGSSVTALGGLGADNLIDGSVSTLNILTENDAHVVNFSLPEDAVGPITTQTVRVWFNHAFRTGKLATSDGAVILDTFSQSDPPGWREYTAPPGYEGASSWTLFTAVGNDDPISFGELEREITYEAIQEIGDS